ncbi:hypothetical protein EPUS_05597 [Endocarpon pusillum Z07020]|uniref:Ribosome assembly factor mrt4 n=1 Tax=Endocarpon pusillum (strain Z07020 / HMAS-L-300199) TaxID=1263415 RepID=U1HN15_ENDPU|nr:uncharacterized protein EPUS_05597 [Endocarpon pusillum Z07020]ERF71725.1 hypothetical protein EPUS_05597 [Endocarpon pusillum Z07020]
MPRSKRARVIPTSKTGKNRKELVQRLHSRIQAAIDAYPSIWVFSVQNMRNSIIKRIRAQLGDNSRIFMGKTKLMVHALGASVETEYAPGLSGLTPYMRGEVGLLCTRLAGAEVEGYFAAFSEVDYARAGTRAEAGFTIPRGELRTRFGVEGAEGEEDLIPVAVEPTLRKLGVPTRIVKGRVVLEESAEPEGMEDGEDGYVVCRPGDVLDSRQTTLLKIFGVRMAEFKVSLRAVWEKVGGTVREVGGMDIDATAEP